MITGDARPVLIVHFPIELYIGIPDIIPNIGVSWKGSIPSDVVNFITRRTRENENLVGSVPIPFYFYERTSSAKDASDEAMGFMLDTIEENIDISYPETPTANTPGSTKATVLTIRNTIDIAFRVKMNSTIVSVLRALLKRALTDYDTAKNIRFSFFWNEYVLSNCKMVDYNEAAVTGTDLTVLKLKLETFQPGNETATDTAGTTLDLPEVSFTKPVMGA